MKALFAILAILALTTDMQAQQKNSAMQAAAKAAAEKMDNALLKKDFVAFVNTTYPKAIEMSSGGKEKMMADLKRQLDEMEQRNTRITKAWPGEPSAVIDTAGELQCTIPNFMEMELSQGTLTTETTLIGLSPDKGKTWYFIDASDRDITTMRGIFPTMSSKLVLNKSPQPEFKAKN